MAGRPEFLSVLGRVRFSLSNGNFPSLNFKPLQVKCFESILKGQDIIEVSYLLNLASRCYFTALYRSRHDKAGTTNVALVKATKHKANAATIMKFAWRTEAMVVPDHKVAITKQPKHC